ncbi:aminotransferase class V-fold PLP-dependent enzyme [Congregibacter litoralis]|uniref:cysteine desulfurase n=1 Tax=Congregibacter litoralis KT71 TaxID=314285 RepID=A4A470_9GAMM|nr:aminotransferase class V-fold PLP-dependent enzyme [Congregibacter litoralis]EAQ99493.1 cysteine desulfurase IscS [Congregibacter litoralis KT71]
MTKLVYFDYLSTTPVDPAVAEAMTRCLTMDGTFGNPASRSHRFGWEAEMAVENARQQLASLINADLREIAWTSGATESDNLALKGVVEAAREAGNATPHLVTSAIEHKAVLDSARHLESQGVAVTYLKPDGEGLITPDAVRGAIQDNSCLVSVMHANNEIGTTNDIAGIAAVCREVGVPLHVDAAQSVGKIPVDVKALDVDLLSISAHKFYGPKGIGALYQRRNPRVAVAAQMHGGGHERGLRAGTLPTHQIVGMGQAAATAREALSAEVTRLTYLRERLWSSLSGVEGLTLNGHPTQRLPGALNISVAGVEGEALLLSLPEFALSTGSACTSASLEPSYVLRSLGLPDALAHSSLRVSLGRFSDENDVQLFSDRLREVVSRLRRDTA